MRTLFIYTLCFTALLSAMWVAPQPVSAANVNYVPLAPIDVTGSELTSPGFDSGFGASTSDCRAPTCFPRYLRTLYNIGIVLAGLFAVVSIVRGGFTLMFTDSILGHSEGKGIILRALGGLLIVYSSYILMNLINPALGRDLDLALQFPRITILKDASLLTVVTSETVQDAWVNQLKVANAEIRSLKEQAAEKRALALAATDPVAKKTLNDEATALEARALAKENATSPTSGIKNDLRQALGALWDTGYAANYNIKDAQGKEIPLGSASRDQRIYASTQFLLAMDQEAAKIVAKDANGVSNIPAAEQGGLQDELAAARAEVLKQIGYLQQGCRLVGSIFVKTGFINGEVAEVPCTL